MLCIRHFLIATDALLRHEIRISAAPSRRTILIVNIHHDVMVGTLPHGLMQPSSPLLRTDLHEAKLDAADAPLLIEWQYLVEFLIECTLVDIHPHSDTLALGIGTKLWHINITTLQHLQGRGRHLHLWSIPSGIEFDILQTSIHAEVNSSQTGLHIQATYTECLTRLYPRSIGDLARSIEVEHQLLVVDEVDSLLSHHDESPRHIIGGDDVGKIEHRHFQLIVSFQLEFASHEVGQGSLADSSIKSVGKMERQRSFCLFLPCRLTLQEFYLVGMRLRPSIMVSLSAWGKAEGSQVIGDVHKQAIGCLREMITDGNTLIVGSHDDVEEILLTFVIAIATIVVLAALHQVEGHLIVMVTYLGILAIDRLPSIVLGTVLHARHLHTFGPHSVGIYRDSHRRLHQMVVDVHA